MLLLEFFRTSTVGSDYEHYISMINENVYSISWKEVHDFFSTGADYTIQTPDGMNKIYEFGFSFIVLFLSDLGISPQNIISIIIFIIIMLNYFSFKLFCNKQNIAFCFVIFFGVFLYYASFNTIRQSLAIAIISLSVAFFYREKKKWSLLCLVLACSVHTTTLIVIPFLILYFIKIPKKVIVFTIITMIAIDIFKLQFIFYKFFPTQIFAWNTIDYLNGDNNNNTYVYYFGVFLHMIMGYVIFIFLKNSDEKTKPLINLWLLGYVLYILFLPNLNTGRVSEFFYFFQIPAIVNIYQSSKEIKEIKVSQNLQILVILYLLSWHIFYIARNWYGIVPYEFNL